MKCQIKTCEFCKQEFEDMSPYATKRFCDKSCASKQKIKLKICKGRPKGGR